MVLKREIYDVLRSYKNSELQVCNVFGKHCTGKTYVVNHFADTNFQNKIYINLSENSGSDFMKCIQAVRKMKLEERGVNLIDGALRIYDQIYEEDRNTIIILDDVQASADLCNEMPELFVGMRAHVIIVNSGVAGVAACKYSIELDVLSLKELVCNYSLFGLGNDSLEVYVKIGGYPKGVSKYLEK